jgi:hypothetical protein
MNYWDKNCSGLEWWNCEIGWRNFLDFFSQEKEENPILNVIEYFLVFSSCCRNCRQQSIEILFRTNPNMHFCFISCKSRRSLLPILRILLLFTILTLIFSKIRRRCLIHRHCFKKTELFHEDLLFPSAWCATEF